jgi:phasin family protein
MTTLTVEQILAANKNAVVEAQNLASTALAGFQKLVDLNMAATKSALFESNTDVLAAFSTQNPADALAAQAALVKPLAEKSVAYGRSVAAIAAETTAEFTKVAEAKAAESQKAVTAAIESLAKNAPAGSETVVAALKSAVTAGQQAIDTAKSSAQKAVEMAEKQIAAATDNALSAVKTTPSRKK